MSYKPCSPKHRDLASWLYDLCCAFKRGERAAVKGTWNAAKQLPQINQRLVAAKIDRQLVPFREIARTRQPVSNEDREQLFVLLDAVSDMGKNPRDFGLTPSDVAYFKAPDVVLTAYTIEEEPRRIAGNAMQALPTQHPLLTQQY
jgi:hypothetical protein